VRAFLHTVKDQPDPQLMARSATRASAVTGALLEGIADARHAPGKQVFGRLALVSRFLFQFVEVSVPHTVSELFGKYWLQLLALFSLMLLAIGFFDHSLWNVAAIAAIAVAVLFSARQLLRRYLRGQLLLSPGATMGMTAALVVGLAVIAFLLPTLSPPLQQALEAAWSRIVAAWQAGNSAAAADRLRRFANALLAAAILVTVASGAVVRRVIMQVPPSPGGAKNPVRRMQLAKTTQDVLDAVGRYDLATRGGVAQAMRADFGFAAAYSLLFVAIGLFLTVRGEPMALIVGVLGVAAGMSDALENRAVLAALTPPPAGQNPVPPPASGAALSPAPFRFAVVKWALAIAAIAATIGFAIW
jgi:hypothetical protein